jgi:hypothetical protein
MPGRDARFAYLDFHCLNRISAQKHFGDPSAIVSMSLRAVLDRSATVYDIGVSTVSEIIGSSGLDRSVTGQCRSAHPGDFAFLRGTPT